MPSTTLSPPPEIPSLAALDKRLTRDWDIAADPARTLKTAIEIKMAIALRSRPVDLAKDLKVVWHAAAAFWDLNAFDEAMELIALWREAVELIGENADVAEARIWCQILSAELEHRRRRYDVAVHYGLAALVQIRKMAGGEQEMHRMLKFGEVTPITEMACAALAISIPAGRMYFRLRPTLRTQYLDRWIDGAKLILRRDLPPPFFRIHALVIQTYYALAERRDLKVEVEWLNRLERFDDLVRPRTVRGLATKRLRHIARARFDGDSERELAETRLASNDLRHLPRHRHVLTANHWWSVEAGSDQELRRG